MTPDLGKKADLDSGSIEGKATKKQAPKARKHKSPERDTNKAAKTKSHGKDRVKEKTEEQKGPAPELDTISCWGRDHDSLSAASSVRPEPPDPWTAPQTLSDSLDSHRSTFLKDFNHLVKHMNTTFRHLQTAQAATADWQPSDPLGLPRPADVDEKASKPAIKLEDCLTYDHQSNVFQLNTIPLKILLLQGKRHIAQKYMLEAMDIVWQHKSIVAEAVAAEAKETQVNLYSFQDVSSSLLAALASIETLKEADSGQVGAIRGLLQASGSAEFFFLGLLGDFQTKSAGKLTGSEEPSSAALPR